MRLNIIYVKSKMTYITGMCLRKSFNLLRGREGCWLYGVYEEYQRVSNSVDPDQAQ